VRQFLIEKTFNRLAKLNGITDKLEINRFQLDMNIQPNVQDLLNILQSPLDNTQKLNILLLVGYTEEEAKKLII
jgi:hypothetical protein